MLLDRAFKVIWQSCLKCHLVAAGFSTSLPIGMRPLEAFNESRLLSRKKSEVNDRALVAATSASWNDMRLNFDIIGFENTWKTMPRTSLNTFFDSSLMFANDQWLVQRLTFTRSLIPQILMSAGNAHCRTMQVGTYMVIIQIRVSLQRLRFTRVRFWTMF